MKRIGRLIVSIFFVFVLFSFVSCKEPASSNTEIIPKPDTGIVPDEENQTPSLENKEMGFNVVLPGKNISRAVYYTKDDASYYTVVLKKEETVICSKNGNPGETLKFTVTEEGDYNFSVSAYDNKDSLIAEGVVSKKITVTDGYVLVKVTLNPKLKELDVNIDIEIDWNEDDINYASEGIRIGEKLFSKTNEIYVISKESGNKTIIGKNLSGPFIESRKVVLSPYVMGQYEVTQELFEAIMGVNPSVNKSTSETENINLRPVDSTNWYQVIAFCNKLSLIQNLEPVYSVEGITDWEQLPFDSIPTSSNAYWDSVVIDLSKNGYRLPTEAEWEYAARGGSIESSYWDTNFAGSNNYDSVAWVNENSNSVSHEVGLKDANSLGFYDMSGNVWEWCNDLYASSIGISSSDVINPMNVRSGDYRTQRGGCWKDYELDAFVYNRRSDACGGGSSAFWDDWGFRLCRSLTNTESNDNTEYFGEEFFGGNSNVNVEEAFNSKQFYLRGNMNNWCNDALNDGALTKNEEGIYSIVYIANCMEDEFCIADSFWSMKFCGIDVSVGNDFVELIPYAGPNAKILNQVPGNSYKMIIEPLESTVRVKVELYEKNIPSFYLKNSNSETIEMVYDRTSYTYQFTALSESESFSFWSDNGFYYGDLVVNNEEILSVCNGLTETTISGLIPNKNYDIILYVIDEKVNICVLQHCPYFIIGSFSYNGDNVWKKMTASNIDNVYIYEFTYVSSMSNNDWWTSPSNGISFVITNRNGSFDAVFNGVELTSDYVVSRGYGDALATNLLEGRTYIIYLKEENGLYFAKIEEK